MVSAWVMTRPLALTGARCLDYRQAYLDYRQLARQTQVGAQIGFWRPEEGLEFHDANTIVLEVDRGGCRHGGAGTAPAVGHGHASSTLGHGSRGHGSCPGG